MKYLKEKKSTSSSSTEIISINVKTGLSLKSEIKAGLYFAGGPSSYFTGPRNGPSNELGGRSSATSGISWY